MKISPDLHILKQLILLQDMAQASAYTSFMSGKDYPSIENSPNHSDSYSQLRGSDEQPPFH